MPGWYARLLFWYAWSTCHVVFPCSVRNARLMELLMDVVEGCSEHPSAGCPVVDIVVCMVCVSPVGVVLSLPLSLSKVCWFSVGESSRASAVGGVTVLRSAVKPIVVRVHGEACTNSHGRVHSLVCTGPPAGSVPSTPTWIAPCSRRGNGVLLRRLWRRTVSSGAWG